MFTCGNDSRAVKADCPWARGLGSDSGISRRSPSISMCSDECSWKAVEHEAGSGRANGSSGAFGSTGNVS